jgi:hypothetical protein
VKDIFNDEDVGLILRLLSSSWEIEDKIMWHYSENREYSVKSGYKMACELRI